MSAVSAISVNWSIPRLQHCSCKTHLFCSRLFAFTEWFDWTTIAGPAHFLAAPVIGSSSLRFSALLNRGFHWAKRQRDYWFIISFKFYITRYLRIMISLFSGRLVMRVGLMPVTIYVNKNVLANCNTFVHKNTDLNGLKTFIQIFIESYNIYLDR